MLTRARARIRGLIQRRRIEGELDEELRYHVEREIDANIRHGMSLVEARRAALRDLGGLTQTIEAVRELRSTGAGAFSHDVRYGIRALAATPRFTTAALLTIVLMVGGITTIFALVEGVLLRPLPYPHANRLVIIESIQPKRFGTYVDFADARAFRENARSFDAWGLYRPGYVTSILDGANPPLPVADMRVTPELFPLLGINVVAGRALQRADSEPGAPEVAVISHDLWQAHFGGREDVVGKTVQGVRESFVIVGVTAPGADVPTNWLSYPIVWRPVREGADSETPFTTLARLRPGVLLHQANAEVNAVAARLAIAHPETHRYRTASASRLLDKIVGNYRKTLWIFFGAVACGLLIGVCNLVSLQVARNGARDREITLRAALGASRWRLVRQLVVECVLLTLVGGALGVALAWPAIRMIIATLPRGFPRVDAIAVDVYVGLFATAVSLTVGMTVGLVSAWRVSLVDLTLRLNEGGRSATLGRHRARLQRALIALETAVALALLIGAGLLANSFQRLISRDAGMREDNLWVVSATLPTRYQTAASQTPFWTTALEQIREQPGVQSAAVVVNATGPLSGGDMLQGGVVPEGQPETPRGGISLSARRVSGDYFSTLGITLTKGRPILESDIEGSEPVVVINELAAATLWPDADPIGNRLRSRGQLKTVVGVIPTFRHSRLDGGLTPQMYTPYRQQGSIASTTAIMVRAADGGEVIAAIKSRLSALEADLKIDAKTMAQVRWKLLATERFRAAVLVAFAASAVFLALVGILGLVSYTVRQREREIAVRVALGAVSRDVIRVVLRHVISPAVVGLVCGVAVATLSTGLLSSFLVDMPATDPATFAAAVAGLALVALLAALLPAARGVRIAPAVALRLE